VSEQSDNPYAFNPFDPSQTQHMWDLMGRMRAEAPVTRPTEGFVFVARHAEVKATFRDAKRFSSAEGFRAAGVVVPDDESFLGEIDPPLHTGVRRLLLRAFTPQGAVQAEPWTRRTVGRMLDLVEQRGGGDLMELICTPLPGGVAAHALGLDDELHDDLTRWCQEMLHSTWPQMNETERGVGIGGGFPDLARVIDQAIAERRAETEPARDDLLTRMVQAKDADGTGLSDIHIRTLAVNTIAGSLSATYLLGNLLYRLVTERAEFTEVLRSRPDLIPMAVEESLRYEPPVLFLFRTAKDDVEIAGCPVHKGERVIVGIASANRDERVYEHADMFRLDRDKLPDDNLSFGDGPHLCLGNHLTRMVGRVVLEEVLDRFGPGQLRLAPGYEKHLVPMFLEYGPETIDVEVAR
jgi:cytochrome P450